MGERKERRHRMEALGGVPLFDRCTSGELARIDGLGSRIEVGAGKRLTRQGGRERECFVVLDGHATASAGGQSLGIIGPGSVAGEMSLLSRSERVATVVADTPMSLLVLTDRELEDLMALAPSVEDHLRRVAAERQHRNALLLAALPVATHDNPHLKETDR